jgi:DNA-binding GntR family transcriptional regulator
LIFFYYRLEVVVPIPKSTPFFGRPSLRESVYEQLRDWIIAGVLEPQEILRDQELAERLGVSRTPVREALRRLEDEGLVETAKNRWTRVRMVHLEEARQIYPIVRALELLALELALPRLSAEDLGQMQAANAELKTALDAANPEAATVADVRLHNIIIQRSQNPELIVMLAGLKQKYTMLERLYFGSASLGGQSVRDHEQLIRALKKRDLERAKAILTENWSLE